MRDLGQLYFATNKEIHDTLFSAKQKVTESVVHDLLRDRGIICSPHDTREALIRYLSVLPHDYADICGLLEKREATKRGEKAATVAINIPLTSDELKDIVAEYQSEEVDEIVHSHKKSEDEFVVNVTYSEFDYSKTRLLQRQERDAAIEFVQVAGGTEIRIPATDRARAIVSKLKDRIAEKKKAKVILQEIELTSLGTAEQRTTFFTKLMSTLPNFTFVTATRLRVAHGVSDADSSPLDIEDEEVSDAEEQMLGVVRSVALSGENLVASKMYQDLKEKGFFVTSLTWEVRQKVDPFLSAELYAGFEEAQAGKKFRYWVQGVRRFKDGQYPKNTRPASDGEKAELLSMIERTARSVLAELLSGGASNAGDVE